MHLLFYVKRKRKEYNSTYSLYNYNNMIVHSYLTKLTIFMGSIFLAILTGNTGNIKL